MNDELLQWRLRAEKVEGQVEKMRRPLDAKDAQVRELQKRLDDVLTAGSGLPLIESTTLGDDTDGMK